MTKDADAIPLSPPSNASPSLTLEKRTFRGHCERGCPKGLAVMLTFFWSASERGKICVPSVDSEQEHIGMTGLVALGAVTSA